MASATESVVSAVDAIQTPELSADIDPQLPSAASNASSPVITVKGQNCALSVFGIYVLPGEEVPFEAAARKSGEYTVTTSGGGLVELGDDRWVWTAPSDPGLYPLTISGEGQSMTLNAFVMVPATAVRSGVLHGYRIGQYPPAGSKHSTAYTPPKGFIEVTRANENTLVAPHFKLKQFLCKQGGSYPKYVVVTERLLTKLELILAEVNRQGYHVETFHVMSGYRTPYYNHCLGNVGHSRHMFGDAADIFIDRNNDGAMDDLNGDGRLDARDSKVLYDIVERMSGRSSMSEYTGGMGFYNSTSNHGPFVHVDARGFRARWEG